MSTCSLIDELLIRCVQFYVFFSKSNNLIGAAKAMKGGNKEKQGTDTVASKNSSTTKPFSGTDGKSTTQTNKENQGTTYKSYWLSVFIIIVMFYLTVGQYFISKHAMTAADGYYSVYQIKIIASPLIKICV